LCAGKEMLIQPPGKYSSSYHQQSTAMYNVHNMLKIASLKQQQKVKMNEYEEGLNVCA
jgi:hypothetical protein